MDYDWVNIIVLVWVIIDFIKTIREYIQFLIKDEEEAVGALTLVDILQWRNALKDLSKSFEGHFNTIEDEFRSQYNLLLSHHDSTLLAFDSLRNQILNRLHVIDARLRYGENDE